VIIAGPGIWPIGESVGRSLVETVSLFSPRVVQQEIFDNLERFNVLVCHRRMGKTVLCINILVRAALEGKKPDMRFAYIAPLFRQAKQVAWDYLKQYTDLIPGRKFYENELRVDLPNGARITLFGGDNVDSLRGIYLDGVIMDEYAQMRPGLWGSVIRPLLTDRQGFGIFIGTPQGHNEFYDLYINARDGFPDDIGKRYPDPTWRSFIYRASDTGIILPAELEAAKREMSPAEFDQEFECSFEAQIRGAYYADLVAEAEEEGRITNVAYDRAVPVHTCWDIGIGDSTVIWYFQLVGQEIHWIDYYEDSGKPLSDYVMELQEHEYVYGEHLLPHDIRARELLAGKSREDVLQELLNYQCRVVENHKVDDGIQNVRNNFKQSWFDRGNCSRGIEALRQYRREFDESKNVFKNRPLHNWCSHPADSFRIGCMGMQGAFSWPELDLPKRVFV
jgi:hypothetical protein